MLDVKVTQVIGSKNLYQIISIIKTCAYDYNASEEKLKSDLHKNASINKNNNLPIYLRSFRIKSSSTGKFDTPYNISEDHISEDSSQNRYGIKMTYPNHLIHRAEVLGVDNFTAENTITFDGSRVTTDYKMQGKGILEGSVMASSKLGRLNPVTRTKIEDSNFTIHSGVEDKAKLVSNSDIDKLSNDAEETKVGSEERQDESKKKEYYDFLEKRTKKGIPDTTVIRTGGIPVGVGITPARYWFIWGDISQGDDAKKKIAKESLIRGLIKEYIPAPTANPTSQAAAGKVDGTIIPGLIFESPLNSVHIDRSAITGSSWDMAYIGQYKPGPEEKDYGNITGNYSLKEKEGIFEFENKSIEGPKQKYLNIRYEGERIKIRNTPTGASFDTYNGPL